MSNTYRLNGFPQPETAARYGVAEGRPVNKRTKTIDSYRRLVSQLTTGATPDGQQLEDEDMHVLHGIVQNRADRLRQLGGGTREIQERNHQHRVNMLRRSTTGKLLRFEEMEKSA